MSVLDFLTTSTATDITLTSLLIYTVASLIFGLAVAGIYMFKNQYSKSFVVTLALLPAMVQIVIMMVNGNLGTGVAVMGAFSLVRFRSVPGSAREIGSLFFAMALGLATGMGYILYAAVFLVLIGGAMLLLAASRFGTAKSGGRLLKITIPENLDYDGLFDDLFEQYTGGARLIQVRTTNMGSLFELQYDIKLREETVPKAFLDALRCRNGNLNIVCGRYPVGKDEL